MIKSEKDITLVKLEGLKRLNKEPEIKKVYAQKNLCGVNTKYVGTGR